MPARRFRAARRRLAGDAGFATAETAVALPVLLLLFGLLMWGITAATAQLRCVDAARAGARAAARGEADQDSLAVARAAAPTGAWARLTHSADLVTVVVGARIGPPLAWRRLPLPGVRATAVAEAEPEVVPP